MRNVSSSSAQTTTHNPLVTVFRISCLLTRKSSYVSRVRMQKNSTLDSEAHFNNDCPMMLQEKETKIWTERITENEGYKSSLKVQVLVYLFTCHLIFLITRFFNLISPWLNDDVMSKSTVSICSIIICADKHSTEWSIEWWQRIQLTD